MSPEEFIGRKGRARKRDRVAGALMVLALLAACALAGRRLLSVALGPPPIAVGSRAPNFEVLGLDGQMVRLSDYRDQVVLMDFWATWCPPCVASLPALNGVSGRFSDRGFVVLGVNQEPGEEARVRAFVHARSIRFPVVVDTGDISSKYGVYALPTSFLVDRNGIVRSVFRGAVSERGLQRSVEALLNEDEGASRSQSGSLSSAAWLGAR